MLKTRVMFTISITARTSSYLFCHPNGFAIKTKLNDFIALHSFYIAKDVDCGCYNAIYRYGVSCSTWLPLNAQAFTTYNEFDFCWLESEGKYAIHCRSHWWNCLENRIRGKRVLHCNHCRAIVRYDVSVIDGIEGTQHKTELQK